MKIMFVLLTVFVSFSAQSLAAEQGMSMMKNGKMGQQGMQQNYQRCYTATGVVRKIDRENGNVTIFYDAVPALMWPPMTMPFAVRDDELFEHLKVGDRVEFEFVLEARTGVIVAVK